MKKFLLILGLVFIHGFPPSCSLMAQDRKSTNRMLPAEIVRNDYTVTPVTTAAFVELDSSIMSGIKPSRAGHISMVQIFDSSGQTLELAVGPSGSEMVILNIEPGGNGLIPIFIGNGARLAVRAISANAVAGELIINTWFEER